MPELPQVLCLSRDQRLLETRVALLSRQYRVVPVSSLTELFELPIEQAFDLVLFCHTVSEEDCEKARPFIKQRWPSAKVLSMTKGNRSCAIEEGEIVVRALDGPSVLLQRIQALLHPAIG